MAEALAIIGLAGNIVQFVDFGLKLIKDAKKALDSVEGVTKEISQLRRATEDIKNQSLEAASTARQQSKDEIAIRDLANQSIPLADTLLRTLQSLTMRKDAWSRKIEAIRVSTEALFKRNEIRELEGKLRLMDTDLRFRIAQMMQKERYSSTMLALQEIKRKNDDIEIQVSSGLNRLRLNIDTAARNSGAPLRELSIALNRLSDEGRKLDRQQAVLRSLLFQELKRRQNTIDEAHFKTLKWLFSKSKTSFLSWLESGTSMYWINGEAGSGKSTLMKYAVENEHTTEALKGWAGSRRLITASFFFWNSGTPLQKSQEGLLRSILFQILRSNLDLIPIACPDQYDFLEPWSLTDLNKAFMRLVGKKSIPDAFCFFIDGLDEYGGKEQDIIDILSGLTQSPHVKICASSRPWPAFERTFTNKDLILIVQDLTMDDMRQYTKSTLAENPDFRSLAERDARCNGIIPEIAKRANGVWLWVSLVSQEINEGIKYHETYDKLKALLDSIPPILQGYFAKIMEQCWEGNPAYKREAAQIFLIVTDAVRPLPLLALTFLEAEANDPDYAVKAKVKAIEPGEMSAISSKWITLLKRRCRDLLKVHPDSSEKAFFEWPVDFLHRTVRDFLRETYKDQLIREVPPGFDPKVSLCKMMITLLKGYPLCQFREDFNVLLGLADEFLCYAWELEQKGEAEQEIQFTLLDQLDEVMTIYACDERNHWTNARDLPTETVCIEWIEQGKCSWLALAIQARLRLYVEHKLIGNPSNLDKPGRPLLDYALRPRRVTPIELPYHFNREIVGVDEDTIAMLLGRGADPNHKIRIYDGQTPWSLFVLMCYDQSEEAPLDIKHSWFRVAKRLIEHEARLDFVVRLPSKSAVKTGRYHTAVESSDKVGVGELLNTIFTADQMAILKGKMADVREQKMRELPEHTGLLGWVSKRFMSK